MLMGHALFGKNKTELSYAIIANKTLNIMPSV